MLAFRARCRNGGRQQCPWALTRTWLGPPSRNSCRGDSHPTKPIAKSTFQKQGFGFRIRTKIIIFVQNHGTDFALRKQAALTWVGIHQTARQHVAAAPGCAPPAPCALSPPLEAPRQPPSPPHGSTSWPQMPAQQHPRRISGLHHKPAKPY